MEETDKGENMKIKRSDKDVEGRPNDGIINTKISQETRDALDAIDANIRLAHIKARDILVG